MLEWIKLNQEDIRRAVHADFKKPYPEIDVSGIGKSHGYYGFLAFSNEKAILKQRVGMTATKHLYPPYGFAGKKIIEGLLKWL